MNKFLHFLYGLLPLLLLTAGSAAVTAGAWMIFQPAGWIIGGAVLIAAAVLMIRGGDDNEHKN